MDSTYWGLSETPFQNAPDPSRYFNSPRHDEALARLFYLVEERRRCGLLCGPAGTGKTFLLQIVATQLRRSQRATAYVDLTGLGETETLRQLANAFGLAPGESRSSWSIWQLVRDHLNGLRLSGFPTVLILDHLDRALPECLGTIHRLLHLDTGPSCWLTMLIAANPMADPRMRTALAGLSDLQAELTYLDGDETARYVEQALGRAGSNRLFSPQAIDELFKTTRGEIRQINRVCDLCLLAGMNEQRDRIDAETVADVAAQLLRAPVGLPRPNRAANNEPTSTAHDSLASAYRPR